MEGEDEDVGAGGVGGPDHLDNWMYSCVGTERAAAPLAPQ